MTLAQARYTLLSVLHPTGYRDLRAFLAKQRTGEVSIQSVPVDDWAAVDAFARANHSRDVYCGVAPRVDAESRDAEGCAALYAVFADQDFKDSSEADARARLAAFALPPSAVVHSGGGLQSYWFLTDSLDLQNGGAAFAKHLLLSLATTLGADLKAAEPARILRLPGTLNYKYPPTPRPVVVETCDDRCRYNLADMTAVLSPIVTAEEGPYTPLLSDSIPDGNRNDTLFREGCKLRRLGYEHPEIEAALQALNLHRCHPPLDRQEVSAIAHSCTRYKSVADSFPTTEAGDAEFFAACFHDRVRYDHRRGHYLHFQDHHWRPQTTGEVHRFALEAVRARQAAAVRITDQDTRKRHLNWAMKGEERKRQTNLLALARNEISLADAGDRWDADEWLLGVENGVIDLRTGQLRAGDPADRITLRARAQFDPNGKCPLWDVTVAEIFDHDADLISYFDRYVGYSLTGDCREETLAFCWGGGANGKGTLMNTIGWLLGDYADDLPFSALELHERGGIPNDIAKIVGKRFVTSSESGETARLNEARVKALTGRDPITARFLHREYFTFQPVAKFWLATNQKPEVRDTSIGFWRRIHLIPFTRSFADKPDLQLKDKLRLELPGILARAVRGCLAWQREGLNPPTAVLQATDAYRTDSRPLARFLDECCVLKENAREQFGRLFDVYRNWASSSREGRLSRREFGDELHARFQTDPNDRRNVVFLGIGLLAAESETSRPPL
jgi:putative DNA primase/helicase